MVVKSFAVGVIAGLLIGILSTVGLGRSLAHPNPVYLSGTLGIVTESYPDPELYGKPYLTQPVVLRGPVYVSGSSTVDLNELYPLRGKPVAIRGEIEGRTLETGEYILQIEAQEAQLLSSLPPLDS
ncbi:hypothetical protein [Leptolyngbya sp. KIOST-1]|uniref:hypothetical protein n=1 Tax=Leptolyngbya sp. KIOST-1 TaxID=1229172 RepID=UPI0012E0BD57|nr:hypothetical protein [Leptolyngbya sp. KIOST-1]